MVREDLPPGYAVNTKGVITRTTERTGRNEPCHCGSQKKFKKCHGKADE
jgi:uncharacterized protein YchJ